MLKRLKVWTYLAVAVGTSVYSLGCSWFNGWDAVDHWPRILTAILNEDILG